MAFSEAQLRSGDYTSRLLSQHGTRIGILELPVHANALDLGKVQGFLTELLAAGRCHINLIRPSVGVTASSYGRAER